jgi:hypothetical protein
MTISLIIRLQSHHRQSHQYRQRNRFRPSKKLTIHLCIYVLWSLIYYCPPAFYNLFAAIDSNQHSSPVMKSTGTVIGVLGIQLYPILTYFIYWDYKEGRKRRSRVRPQRTILNTITI